MATLLAYDPPTHSLGRMPDWCLHVFIHQQRGMLLCRPGEQVPPGEDSLTTHLLFDLPTHFPTERGGGSRTSRKNISKVRNMLILYTNIKRIIKYA